MTSNNALISVRNLSVSFNGSGRHVPALTGIELDIFEKEGISVVGESGCGKSVLAHAILNLIDDIADMDGRILYRGNNLLAMKQAFLQNIRGKKISLLPQSAATAFNPVVKIGKQICEFIEKTGAAPSCSSRERALHFLARASFDKPEEIFNAYPHRLSGGMRQRALIALAVSSDPDLLVADEPTKGLDPDAAADVSKLLQSFCKTSSVMMITHDLNAGMQYDRVAVMYAGQIVETGKTCDVFSSPGHPYTKGLINAMPQNGMHPIPGIRNFGAMVDPGCRFQNRCDRKTGQCNIPPAYTQVSENRFLRCHNAHI